MNLTEMRDYIDKRAIYRPVAELSFFVTVTNAKMAYGRTLLQVTPVNGTGRKWVEVGSLAF